MVYLGEVPKYVQDNAINFSSLFPEFDTIVLTDDVKSQKRMENCGIQTWLCSDQLKSNPEIVSISNHDSTFRQDFWLKTVLRFFAIEEYMCNSFDGRILHIEADVWLAHDFPLTALMENAKTLAYPLKSKSEGIASTVFIPSLESLQVFNEFIVKSFHVNPRSTDVSILGEFHQRFPHLHFNLPTAPPSPFFFKTRDFEVETLSKNFDLFHGLFDASSLGIFYTGIDPRNNWGWRDLFVQLDHNIDFMNCSLKFENSWLYLDFQDQKIPIFSLHIHSKDRRFFNYASSELRLISISARNQNNRAREFSIRETTPILLRTFISHLLLGIRQVFRRFTA